MQRDEPPTEKGRDCVCSVQVADERLTMGGKPIIEESYAKRTKVDYFHGMTKRKKWFYHPK